ncbi:ParA family protein [Thauera sinica]|uniref:ParA family protein n=1 Tax=Thauera sinica TaxID=2665146 RepID=A0ABW1ANB9_9RHOO|nr:ParA family protein [Thauera sp. K11]ATE60489.1 cobyrinic acid a,c-diamide synthase [Thauera sp. K11]
MRKIMVANPKGGSGKSTLAVHLASWFARNDEIVYLGDLDRQQSSRHWLAARPRHLAPIRHWDLSSEEFEAPPKDCSIAILDTPAGLHGKRLKSPLNEVDKVVVPVSPSRFDMLASREFFEELAETKAVRKDKVDIGIVGMRIDPRTHASRQLVEFLQQFDLPLVTCIRQAQRYVHAVETSTTMFDGNGFDAVERIQWKPLLDWLVRRH